MGPKFNIGDILTSDITDYKYLVLDVKLISREAITGLPYSIEDYEYTMLVGDKIWKFLEFNMYAFHKMENIST